MKKLSFVESPRFQLLAGLLCLLALLLLVVFGARGKAAAISQSIERQARLQLNDRKLDDISVAVEGRKLTLSGNATQDSVRATAANAVSTIAGVRAVTNKIILQRQPQRAPKTASRPVAPPVLRPKPASAPPDPTDLAMASQRVAAQLATNRAEPAAEPVSGMTNQQVAELASTPLPPIKTSVAPQSIANVQAEMMASGGGSSAAVMAASPGLSAGSSARPPAGNVMITPEPMPVAAMQAGAVERTSARPMSKQIVQPLPGSSVASAPIQSSRLAQANSMPQPYLLQLEVQTGGVAATGYLPGAAVLVALEGRLKLKSPLQLEQAGNAPPMFSDAVSYAAAAAAKLSRGKVRIADRQISIEGWSALPTENFINNIGVPLPVGYVLSVQVSAAGASPGNMAASDAVADNELSEDGESSRSAAALVESQPYVSRADVDTTLPPIARAMSAADNLTTTFRATESRPVADVLSCQTVIDSVMRDRNVEFQFASDDLQSRSEPLLDDIGRAMSQCPNAYLYIVGHTDSVGTQYRNQRLSQNRANSVRNYLLGRGLSAEYVIAEGVGEKQPLFSNSTEDGRARNRRIEFSVRSEPTL